MSFAVKNPLAQQPTPSTKSQNKGSSIVFLSLSQSDCNLACSVALDPPVASRQQPNILWQQFLDLLTKEVPELPLLDDEPILAEHADQFGAPIRPSGGGLAVETDLSQHDRLRRRMIRDAVVIRLYPLGDV